MENTEAQRAINLATDLAASRQECDMLYRELSKVRDELITSKTERRVLSRWYEDAKAERDKLQVAVAELEAGLKASSSLVHAAENERDKLHSELVEVRSALADVSAERDSLRTTLAAWEAADTTPFVKVPDVADHVMPPVLDRGEPDPDNDERDAKLEFRNVVPTPAMLELCKWWSVSPSVAICFKNEDQRPVVWRYWGDYGQNVWKHEDCPQPLKPQSMTWQQMDNALASKNTPTAELPLCDKCHTCGMTLEMRPGKIACRATLCRSNLLSGTMMWDYDVCDIAHPYHEPCRSRHPVRHE